MPKKIKCIKTPKRQGQKALVLANKMNVINKEFEIQRDCNFVYIPLIDQPPQDGLKTLTEEGVSYEISARCFRERKKPIVSLVDLLETELPPQLLASLPHAIDFVGDIAIVEIPPELEAHKKNIGCAVLKANKNVRTVLAKAGAVSGTYRLRELEFIAGEKKTETTHKESGCQYLVDVAKVYFSPRLSYEHRRVASLVKEGETVVDLFTGIGPFAILIAKTHENVKAYAIDANPQAFEYLKTNIRLNSVVDKVHAFLGDARQVVNEKILGVADRVIMNLPEKAIEFVDTACNAVKTEGGIVHYYSFVNASNSIETIETHFTEAVEKAGRKVVEVLSSRMIRETAPYEWQVVLDVSIR